MTAHAVKWTAPAPLWPELLTDPDAESAHFARPAILRFADDAFMEQFIAVLERNPAQIGDFLAAFETWQEPRPKPDALSLLQPVFQESKLARQLKRLRVSQVRFPAKRGAPPPSPGKEKPLKLFHPAHQRFYLVTASLVCGLRGFTDHKIDTAHEERVSFVVRRLLPPRALDAQAYLPDPRWEEHAFVAGAGAPGWQKVDPEGEYRTLVAGEEPLPLFPVHYNEDDGRRRRILAGVVPVARREAYLGAVRSAPADTAESASASRPKTARVVLFRTRVAEPWKSLVQRGARVAGLFDPVDEEKLPDERVDHLVRTTREQIQVVSWYVLLDFAKYLEKYLPAVWQVVLDTSKGKADLASPAEQNLFTALSGADPGDAYKAALTKGTKYQPSQVKGSLRDALAALGEPSEKWESRLDAVIDVYLRQGDNPNWPPFLFPLADPALSVPVLQGISSASAPEANEDVESEAVQSTDPAQGALESAIDQLVALVARALPKDADPKAPPPPLPLAAQKQLDHREGWFVLRCVYQRSNCGPLHPAAVSEASVPFQMAGFFDPDAPARPIRISLPLDTSPAGLRKFDKNTAFMVSDMLCAQIKRAKGLSLGDLVRSVLPWPFHKDLPDPESGACESGGMQFGMICSLSIPIITICALILLIIIVTLLDIIFRWIPYFIICFPFPGFKGKKQPGGG